MGRLKALVILGVALFVTLVKALFGRQRGLAAFVANYAADGLPRVTSDERARMQHFGGCMACGLCDRGTAALTLERSGTQPSIMGLVLADSRSMPDYNAASPVLIHEDAAFFRQAERLCPAGVPIAQIAQFVAGKVAGARVSLVPRPPGR